MADLIANTFPYEETPAANVEKPQGIDGNDAVSELDTVLQELMGQTKQAFNMVDSEIAKVNDDFNEIDEDDWVETRRIKDEAVVTDKIANDAITTPKIENGAVTTGKIKDGDVETDKIKDLAITAPKLASNSVETDKILDNSITKAKMTDDSVGTNEIEDNAVTADKLAFGDVAGGFEIVRSIAQVATNTFTVPGPGLLGTLYDTGLDIGDLDVIIIAYNTVVVTLYETTIPLGTAGSLVDNSQARAGFAKTASGDLLFRDPTNRAGDQIYTMTLYRETFTLTARS